MLLEKDMLLRKDLLVLIPPDSTLELCSLNSEKADSIASSSSLTSSPMREKDENYSSSPSSSSSSSSSSRQNHFPFL